MFVYIFGMALSVLFALIAHNLREQYNTYKTKRLKLFFIVFCILSFLPPFLISAFRDFSVGTDTSGTYYDIYYIVLHNLGGVRDFGFVLINKLAINIFGNYSGLLFITSLLFCGISYKCIFSESKYPILSVLLFFSTNVYFISMNMIRQSIAISIFILSIPYIKNKRFFPFLLLNIISISLHSTSLIYIVLYFVLRNKLKIKYICVFCIFVAIFSNFLSDYIISFLSNFEYFRKYFAWYLNSKFSTGELNLYSLLINVCILLFLIFINKNASDDADYNILLWLETLAVLSLLLSSCIPMMQRISWMFSFPLFIYLPKMFDFVTNSKLKFLLKFSVISCFILYMSITIFVKGYNEVFPYISIFH